VNAPVITTTSTLSANELSDIAERIRARIRRTITHIIATGRDLAEVKAQLGHGRFKAAGRNDANQHAGLGAKVDQVVDDDPLVIPAVFRREPTS
jgi:hypothetical protein